MFTWKILDLFANGEQLQSVRYLLFGTDEINTVESKGNHKKALENTKKVDFPCLANTFTIE